MKPVLYSLLMILSSTLTIIAQSYFTSDPSLSPDGETIVFSYQGDIWTVPTAGGKAARITAMEGEESRPLFSPDGRWIAFSATVNGNKDIFLVPSTGGRMRQVTFHSATDDLDSWDWDSQSIFFTSDRYNRHSGYQVGINGDTPSRLFSHYFNTVHNVSKHPISGEIFFNESWESKIFAHRKRYKGDFNPDIKSYQPDTKRYQEYTNYRGKDFGVTIDRQGNIYYMSDEANGEYNLYTFRAGEKVQLTDFDTSIYWPKVSADGSKVTFRKDYQIHVYDVATGEVNTPSIDLYQEYTLDKNEDFQVSGKISDFAVSPDAEKIALVSRGRLFVSDVKGKFVKKLPTNPKEAIREVYWLADNRTLLFTQSKQGYYNWYTMAVDQIEAPKMLTQDRQNNRALSFNSDRTRAVYLSGKREVRVMDLTSFMSETIVEDELWGFYNSTPRFSPDDRFIAFCAYRHFEQDIFVYDTQKKETLNLTHTMVTESNPFWGPEGKYLYFNSNTTNPNYPYGARNSHIYRIALTKLEDPFKSEKLDEFFAKEGDDDENREEKEEQEENNNEVTVTINPDNILERIERISPLFGSQRTPYVIQNKDETIILYLSDHNEGNPALWKTTKKEFDKDKTEKIGSKRINGINIKEAKGKLFALYGGNLHTLDAKAGKLEEIKIKYTFTKSLLQEFEQMYYEAWAGMEENFYDGDFHGEDWSALRDRYAAFLPYMTNRSDLRNIFNDMLGELNTSHFGFRSSGKEESTYYEDQTIATGIIFNDAHPYTVARIVADSPADYPEKDVQIGDVLIAIDGITVDPTENREKYFVMPYQKDEVQLTFQRGDQTINERFHTISSSQLSNLLYDEWQDTNQTYVDANSNGRIAYLHMKNMGGGELEKFKHEIVREGAYKDGIILDLRYNTGGNVHDEVLNWLSRKTYLKWKYRDGALTSQANFSPSDQPIVLLINEQSLSDAEMTAAGFKELNLGTIIGTETYRWIIFTSGLGLVDGSFYRIPAWGCYTLDGRDLETKGVSPDIRVEKNFLDRLEGKYPQLDKALEVLKE